MCGSVYSYILAFRHYAPNTFSAFQNLPNWRILARILANAVVKISFCDYSIYPKTPENADEYSVFVYSRRIDVCVVPALCVTLVALQLVQTKHSSHSCYITCSLTHLIRLCGQGFMSVIWLAFNDFHYLTMSQAGTFWRMYISATHIVYAHWNHDFIHTYINTQVLLGQD